MRKFLHLSRMVPPLLEAFGFRSTTSIMECNSCWKSEIGINNNKTTNSNEDVITLTNSSLSWSSRDEMIKWWLVMQRVPSILWPNESIITTLSCLGVLINSMNSICRFELNQSAVWDNMRRPVWWNVLRTSTERQVSKVNYNYWIHLQTINHMLLWLGHTDNLVCSPMTTCYIDKSLWQILWFNNQPGAPAVVNFDSFSPIATSRKICFGFKNCDAILLEFTCDNNNTDYNILMSIVEVI